MPFYEYRCEACGHELEALQKLSDAPLTDCPACGQPALKKLISAAGFRLKGSGWYETDFKKKGDKKRNLHGDRDAGGGKKESAKPAEKPKAAESKPAAKPAAKAGSS
jgi:putative FmdB family regulatory protein